MKIGTLAAEPPMLGGNYVRDRPPLQGPAESRSASVNTSNVLVKPYYRQILLTIHERSLPAYTSSDLLQNLRSSETDVEMATSTPPANSSEDSYSAMATADVEAIGAHCQMPFCHQLDFLPFRCDSCHHTYCLDHRSETAHKCEHAGEWARNRRLKELGSSQTTSSDSLSSKPTVLTAQQCGEPQCKIFINTTQSQAVHCQTCNRQYCLKHRFQEDHNCKNLVPLGARPGKIGAQSNAEKIKLGFGKLKSWGKDKQESILPKPKPTSKAVQIANLNKLKQSAKGDAKIPLEKRTYLHVEAEAIPGSTTQTPKKDLFFNTDWPVGRLLDEAAKKLSVENINNSTQGEEGRLRIYHVESGRVLKFSEKVGEALASGNTVVILRGIGDPEASGTQ